MFFNSNNEKFFFYTFPVFIFSLIPFFLITGPFLSDLAISLISLIFLFYCLKKKNFSFFKNKYFYIFLIFWIYLLMNSIFNNLNIDSFKIAIERPANGCTINEDNPCLILKAKYVDPSIKYLNQFMNGPKTAERESLRQMYINYLQAQILAAEALGLIEVVSDLKLILDYIVSDSSQLDMERVSTSISNGTNELYKNANSGANNEEAKKKIEEAHVYAAKAGGEGKLFFSSITAIFSSSNIEDAAGAAEVASRTKGNLAYFYNALKKIREAKNVNLNPETKEQFGDAEASIDI